jgi:hypothetical protein
MLCRKVFKTADVEDMSFEEEDGIGTDQVPSARPDPDPGLDLTAPASCAVPTRHGYHP